MAPPKRPGGRCKTFLGVRWAPAEADTVRFRAAAAGLTVSEYVRRAALEWDASDPLARAVVDVQALAGDAIDPGVRKGLEVALEILLGAATGT